MKKFILVLILIIGCSTVNQAKISNIDFYTTYLKILKYEDEGDYDKAIPLIDALIKKDNDPYLIIKKGRMLEDLKRFDEAKKTFLNYLKTNKNDKVYYELAILYKLHYRDYENSIKYLKKAIKINESKMYLLELASTYEIIRDYSSAIKIFNKILKDNPDPEYLYRRGSLYIKLGLEKQALQDLKESYKLGGYPLALYKLADFYLKKGDNENAIFYLKKIVAKHPSQISLSIKLARLLKEEGEFDEAINIFKRLLNKASPNIKSLIYKQLASIYYEKKDYKNALLNFQKTIEINPEDIQSYFFAGFISEKLGDYQKALSYYNKALEKSPDYVEVKKRLAIIHIQQKDYKKAIDILDSINENEKDVDYYRIKALIYHQQNRFKDALKILESGYKKGIDDEELLFDIVINYEKLKDIKNAEKYLKKILEIDPSNASALNFLGYMWAEKGIKLDEAAKLIKKALKIEPNNPAYIDSMGWVYYQKGEYRKAFEYLKRAFMLAPDEPEIKEHFELILKKLYPEKDIHEFLDNKNE